MTASRNNESGPKLTPEEAKRLIETIEQVEREEAEEQDQQRGSVASGAKNHLRESA